MHLTLSSSYLLEWFIEAFQCRSTMAPRKPARQLSPIRNACPGVMHAIFSFPIYTKISKSSVYSLRPGSSVFWTPSSGSKITENKSNIASGNDMHAIPPESHEWIDAELLSPVWLLLDSQRFLFLPLFVYTLEVPNQASVAFKHQPSRNQNNSKITLDFSGDSQSWEFFDTLSDATWAQRNVISWQMKLTLGFRTSVLKVDSLPLPDSSTMLINISLSS